MVRRAFVFGGLSAGVALAAGSCVDPTQITVAVRTTARCASFSGAAIVAGPSPEVVKARAVGGFVTATTRNCDDGSGSVGTLVVTPGGGSGSVLVAAGVAMLGAPAPSPDTCVSAEGAPGCIVAKRSFAFVEHTKLDLPIELDPVCAGVSCAPADTCFKGSCVSAEVSCVGSNCALKQELPGGSGSGTDASSGDGAYDAELIGDASYDDVYVDAGLDAPLAADGQGDGGGMQCQSFQMQSGSMLATCLLGHTATMPTTCACSCSSVGLGQLSCVASPGMSYCSGFCQP